MFAVDFLSLIAVGLGAGIVLAGRSGGPFGHGSYLDRAISYSHIWNGVSRMDGGPDRRTGTKLGARYTGEHWRIGGH